MKIAVCIKRTPDSESRFRIASSERRSTRRASFDIDDFASYAVEVSHSSTRSRPVVIYASARPVQETLRKVMSMGPTERCT